jgi:two-component system sensor histidine kinase AtoS
MFSNPFARLTGNNSEICLESDDFRLLLDQINKPAILISLAKNSIIAANLYFTELTGFGTDEIIHSGIEKIIINSDYEKITDGMIYNWSFLRKNKNPIKSDVTIQFINKTEKLALFIIRQEKDTADYQDAFVLGMMAELVNSYENILNLSLDDLFHELITASKNIFQTQYSVFYVYDQKSGKVRKTVDRDPIFPEEIPAIEIKRLSQIDFWEPGKRVLSEIHRVGRLNNLQAIVTLPVPIDEFRQGLLIIALKDVELNPNLESILPIFSKWVNGLIKNQQFIEKNNTKFIDLSIENDQFAQFYENASDCALILNDDNIILDFNQNASQFLKYSPIELLNQKAEIIFENSEVKKRLLETTKQQSFRSKEVVTIFDREGNKKPVTYKLFPIATGGMSRKLVIISDAAVRVESEQKVQQLENKAALGDVIADFAHEVRNPIHSFVSGLQVMKKKMDPADPDMDAINQMLDDCFRINDLMESVLSYSRQKVENFKDVDVELLIKRIFSQMDPKFKRAGITTFINLKTVNKTVFADQRSLEQAFINIITNAYDAIKQDGGVISVQIEQTGTSNEFLQLNISDTGPGIPPEIQEKIFEPFVSGKPKGTGLGLAITKRMIEAHKGKIELETYPGGTIFSVILPIQEIQGDQA